MRTCVDSLLKTAPDAEILVYDNGGSVEDSRYLLDLTEASRIAVYTRYRHNLHFYYPRNDGLLRASGDYIAIMDNDILLKEGWLEECIDWLEDADGNYFATPIKADFMNDTREKRWQGEKNGWKLNTRAGSNVWVGHRNSFDEVGGFMRHPKAGSKWCDQMVYAGYLMGVMPEPKAEDLAFRKGYNLIDPVKNTEL